MSDFWPHGRVAQAFGVLCPEGYTERAIFVIDKQGIIRYVDVHDISLQPDNEELFRVLAQIDPQAATAAAVRPAAQPRAEPTPTADVVMYCTPWCPDCRRARAYFKEHNIAYVEVDISRDRAAAQKVREWANGNETTPTFNIKGTIIVNFDRAKVNQALGIS